MNPSQHLTLFTLFSRGVEIVLDLPLVVRAYIILASSHLRKSSLLTQFHPRVEVMSQATSAT